MLPTNHETNSDELFMEEALRAAQRALEAGEVPVGAVVACGGKIVGRGGNRNLTDHDPTAHAEVVALRELKRLVYGADDPKAGAIHSVMQVLNQPSLNHRMEVRAGVLAGRCAELLQSFFRLRREEKSGEQSSVVSPRSSATDE